MKIIDIQLGRGSTYGTTASREAQPWNATIYSRSRSGGSYPDEAVIPAEIAEQMASAAYGALIASGFFEPSFSSTVVDLSPLVEESAPLPLDGPSKADLGFI